MAFLSSLLLLILLGSIYTTSGENISIQYVVVHTSSNSTVVSSSSSISSVNVASTNAPPIIAVATATSVQGLVNNVAADASGSEEATVAPPSEGTVYYHNGPRTNDHFFFVSYDHQIPGVPGKDYPIHSQVPKTEFNCSPAQTGYFADEHSGCQVIHICQADGSLESFLCPNGTIFNQQYLVCDWWFNVDCSQSKKFYLVTNDSNGSASALHPSSSSPSPNPDRVVQAKIQDHTLNYGDDNNNGHQSPDSLEYAYDEYDVDPNKEHS